MLTQPQHQYYHLFYHHDRDGHGAMYAFGEWIRRHTKGPDGPRYGWTGAAYGFTMAEIVDSVLSQMPGPTPEWDQRADSIVDVLLIFADMMPDVDVVRKLLADGYDVLVLDHHETTFRRVNELLDARPGGLGAEPPSTARLRLEPMPVKLAGTPTPGRFSLDYNPARSAAVITWLYFHEPPPPQLLLYVEDRDLWKFSRPWSRELSYWIEASGRTFFDWQDMRRKLEQNYEIAVLEATAISRHVEKNVQRILQHAIPGQVQDHACIAVNSAILQSELGEAILKGQAHLGDPYGDETEIAVIWYRSKEGTTFSLRTSEAVDAGRLAEQFGGGGHARAAGFFIPHGQLEGRIGWVGLAPSH